MSLEDLCGDIISKAQAGLKISDSELSRRANIKESSLIQIKNGEIPDSEDIKKIASILKLDPSALFTAAKKAWKPKEEKVFGLKQCISNYRGMQVNSYLIWDPETNEGLIADTGSNSTMIETINNLKIKPRLLLLTHSHSDHVADLNKIKKKFPDLKAVIDEKEIVPGTEGIKAGMEFQVGCLKISARKTSGHSPGGLTYVIKGLERSIAIVGDSLFAGSMGGAAFAYEEALSNNRQQLLSLPNETIICPGHGPMTTVGEEKAHNPFFPEFK